MVLCVNKVEDQEQIWEMVGEFYTLGLGILSCFCGARRNG